MTRVSDAGLSLATDDLWAEAEMQLSRAMKTQHDSAFHSDASSEAISQKQCRRLEAGLTRRINQLLYLRSQLHLVNEEVLAAGLEAFDSHPLLAIWLAEPARALGDKVPLRTMRTARGRRTVATALRRIAYGVYC